MDTERKWLCYQATNLVNGKRYIGVTGRSLAIRRRDHINTAKYGRGYAFAAAIRQYGADAFDFVALKEGLTRTEALTEEIRLIAEWSPEYNLSPGGDGGGPPSDKQFKRFCEARDAASERRKRPVVCLTDGRRWSSIKEAAAACGAQPSEVGTSCRGLHRYVVGLRFAFDEPGLDMAAEMARRDALQQHRKGFPKPVVRKTDRKQERNRTIINLTSGISYPSVSAAAKALSRTTGQISHACKAKTFGRDGMVIRYADDLGAREGGVVGVWVQGRQRAVECIETNEIFPSATAAGRKFGVTGAAISQVCNGRRFCYTAAGMSFRWVA